MSAEEITLGGAFKYPFNGRVTVRFDYPAKLAAQTSGIDDAKLFNSICVAILLSALSDLTTEAGDTVPALPMIGGGR